MKLFWKKVSDLRPTTSQRWGADCPYFNLFQFQKVLWGFPLDYKYLKQRSVSLFDLWVRCDYHSVLHTPPCWFPGSNHFLHSRSFATEPAIIRWNMWDVNVNPNSMGNGNASSQDAKTFMKQQIVVGYYIKSFLTEWNIDFIFSHFSCIILIMTWLHSKCVEILIHCFIAF